MPPSGGMPPTSAAGHVTRTFGWRVGVAWLLPATPKLRRISTEKIGTCAWAKATIHSPPRRIVPAISCSSPTAKPGLSIRLRIGRWNRSHRSRWRVSLLQPSAVSAPPLTCRLSDAMHADGVPVEAGQADDLVGTPQRADLEPRAAVDEELDHPAHVERRRPLARDDRQQLLVAAVRRITRSAADRRRLVDAGGQVREEALRHRHRLLLGLGEVVHRAVAAVDLPAAEVLLGDVVAHRVADDRRPGDEQLGDVADHHREVAEHGLGGTDADDAAEQDVDDRHRRQLLGVLGAAEVAGQERAAAAADAWLAVLDGARALLGRALALRLLLRHHRRHAAAAGRAVEQPHRGHLHAAATAGRGRSSWRRWRRRRGRRVT